MGRRDSFRSGCEKKANEKKTKPWNTRIKKKALVCDFFLASLPERDGCDAGKSEKSCFISPQSATFFSSLFSRDHYVTGVRWVTPTLLSVVWMNREQNLSVVTHCEQQRRWGCHEVREEYWH